ncbi:hypothetical protein N0V84_012410 [Fusarium piperis]|uniref:Uncharacterized protein n=1 Tax=Fusarium piperis TaxID=1435070 RepID=A0A9W8TA60_9HYPO|nr:hypothetical protein N0V84_012410 [Fusarium piperis]
MSDASESVYDVPMDDSDSYNMTSSGIPTKTKQSGRTCIGGCNGSICNGMMPLDTVLVPGPGMWPDCMMDWRTSPTSNCVVSNDNMEVVVMDTLCDSEIESLLCIDGSMTDVTAFKATGRGSRRTLTYLNTMTSVITHSYARDAQMKSAYRRDAVRF